MHTLYYRKELTIPYKMTLFMLNYGDLVIFREPLTNITQIKEKHDAKFVYALTLCISNKRRNAVTL